MLQRCVALKVVVVHRLVQYHPNALRRTEGCHGNSVISHVKVYMNAKISRQN